MAAAGASAYSFEERGQKFTLTYRGYFKNAEGHYISPFHDIPCWPNPAEPAIVNMICEVPRWSNAKMEVSKELPLNPITQHEKKGKPRYVHNCFPHHGYAFNYGAIPQTWENPEHVDKNTNAKGDNDPIDIVDIGERVAATGEIKAVKVLGVYAMIDEGETDWKILAIDIKDPLADKINDVDDIDKFMPGQLAAINEWFRIYKIPAGKPENQFAFQGEAKNKEFAINIIKETHQEWQKLMAGSVKSKIAMRVAPADAAAIVAAEPPHQPPGEVDPSVHAWSFVRL